MINNYYDYKNKGNNRPEEEMSSIVAVRKDDTGIITDYKLSDGRIFNKEQAVQVAKTEGIRGVNVGATRGEENTEMLRANPTNDIEKALYNLPTF